MTRLLIVVLIAFLATSVYGAGRASRVFSGTPLRRICGATLFIASILVALTAIGGGVTLAIGMDKFPAAWLIGTPFRSYLIPGLILAVVVGGSAAAAVVATLCGPDAGALASMLTGVKYAMDLRGYYGGLARLPLLPLTEEKKQQIAGLVALHEATGARV